MAIWSILKIDLTPTLSGFQISNYATLKSIIQILKKNLIHNFRNFEIRNQESLPTVLGIN